LSRAGIAATLALWATGAAAQPVAASAPGATVDLGRRAYTSYCVRCHGINLQVGSSAFFDLRTFPPDSKERFLRSVNKGLRAMPAWEGVVKPEDIEAIWDYIGSVNGW
jgi:mono/diheme cytochrome c family protein